MPGKPHRDKPIKGRSRGARILRETPRLANGQPDPEALARNVAGASKSHDIAAVTAMMARVFDYQGTGDVARDAFLDTQLLMQAGHPPINKPAFVVTFAPTPKPPKPAA